MKVHFHKKERKKLFLNKIRKRCMVHLLVVIEMDVSPHRFIYTRRENHFGF